MTKTLPLLILSMLVASATGAFAQCAAHPLTVDVAPAFIQGYQEAQETAVYTVDVVNNDEGFCPARNLCLTGATLGYPADPGQTIPGPVMTPTGSNDCFTLSPGQAVFDHQVTSTPSEVTFPHRYLIAVRLKQGTTLVHQETVTHDVLDYKGNTCHQP